jgi:hypothetical protein
MIFMGFFEKQSKSGALQMSLLQNDRKVENKELGKDILGEN